MRNVLHVAARPANRPGHQPLARAWTLPRWIPRERLASLVLVLALASLLRLPFPDLTPFGHDEALEAERARPIWYGARPVDSEVTSWWIPDPAGLLYVLALAEPFPQPAIARVVLVSGLNVLSVVICYLFARRFFGARVGLIAGLLYAVNPWAVTFARQPWVITQPLLTTLMLFSAMMVVARRDRRWIIPFFLAGAAQTQTHLLAVLYGPPVLLTLVLFWRRWLAPQLGIAIVGALALVAPYTLHLWSIRDEILEAWARGQRGITLLPNDMAATLTTWLLSGYNLDRKLGFADRWMAALSLPLLTLAVLTTMLLVVGVWVSARACRRRAGGWEADALLLIWLLAPLALMSWQGSQVYIHYVLCLVPVPFVLIGRGLDGLTGPLRRLSAWGSAATAISLGVVGLVVVVQTSAIVAFYAALNRIASAPPAAISATDWQLDLNREDLKARQIGIGELHGLPLRYWQRVADQTRSVAQSTGIHGVTVVTGILDDANRHLDRRRKALSYLLGPDLDARFPLEGLTVVPTTADTLFLTVPDQELPRVVQRTATRLAEIPQPGTSGAAQVYRVRARPADEVISLRRRTNLPVADGVKLVVLDVPSQVRPGQGVPMSAYLLVEGDPRAEPEDAVPFAELEHPGGSRVIGRRAGLDVADWRNGDLLIQQLGFTAPVDLPAGDSEVAFGLGGPDDGPDRVADRAPPAIRAAVLRVRAEP
jgi:hypothetical protein